MGFKFNPLTGKLDLVNPPTVGGTGILTLNGLSTDPQSLAYANAGTGPAWVSSGSTHTLRIPIASNTTSGGGLIDNLTQNLYGIKRWNYDFVDIGTQGYAAEFSASVANTVSQANDFLAASWSTISGSGGFDSGQLMGALGFASSGTGSGGISSITGLYGWAQSHSAYSGNLGYIYGGNFLARQIHAQNNTGVYGITVEAMTEHPTSQLGKAVEAIVTDGSGGAFSSGYGIDISVKAGTAIGVNINNLDGSSKIGVSADIAGSYNLFRGIRLTDADDSYLRFYESDQTNYVGFKAPTSIASDLTWTLPSADGSRQMFLKTNGSATLSFSDTLANTFTDKTSDNYNFQSNVTITNTGNIASSHNEFASYSILSKTDNFNQTGIGFFAASVSGASHTGSGTFGNTYLVSSLNATTVSGSGTHNRVYGGYTGSSQTSGSTVSKLYGHYSYATSGAISITTDVYGYSADITCLNNITNSYGFIVESISLSGTGNKYAFFCDDTGAKSVFAGGVYGSTAGGILQLSGSTTLASRVEVLATQDFRLVANSGSNQSYQFTRAVNNHLDLQGLKAGSLTSLRMFCADGDGTDSNSIQIFAVGTPGATTNSEVLAFGWDNTNTRFGIQTGATGSGTVRNLHIYTSSDTDQFVLNSNGDISIQDYITFDTAVKRQEHTTTVIDLGLGGSQLNYTNQVNISNTATQTNDPTIIGGNVFVEKTDNFAENGSGLYCGFNSSFIFNGTNTIGSSNITVGIIGTLSNDSTGTFSGPLAVGVAGSVTNNVAGTLTSCVSVYADMDNFDVGGTISVGYGFKASLANSGGGTFTTAAVLYSDTIEATNKYGVWIDVDGSINKLHELQILDANAVKWYDTDSSNYVAFKGAGTISSNVTWTLPTSDAQGAFISDGSAAMSIKTLNNGTYTPTLTNVTNISASTPYKCQWMRVGNTVTVSGKADIDITSVGAYELGISLPVASNFSAEEDCCGVVSSVALNEYSPYIKADATNNRASLNGSDNDTSNHSNYFTFTYEVI